MARLHGAARFRRLLAGIEPGMRQELTDAMREGGQELLADMKAIAPVLEKADPRRVAGFFESRLKLVFFSGKTLRMRIGLDKSDSQNNSRVFYARFEEFGTKAQTLRVQRRNQHGGLSSYTLRSPKRARHPTIYKAGLDARGVLHRKLEGIWLAALKRAAATAGGGDV